MSSASIDEVLQFWFEELTPKDWFRKDEALDSTIASRFGALYHELRAGVPESWLATPEGYLAATIVLDQFPRNMFRGDARAFATDEASLAPLPSGRSPKAWIRSSRAISASSSACPSSIRRTATTRRGPSRSTP